MDAPGAMLRSLELRESIEAELIHAVEKLKKLRARASIDSFRGLATALEAERCANAKLKEALDAKDSELYAIKGQLADTEQAKAGQLVELMELKTTKHANNVEQQTEYLQRARKKDSEIAALNEHNKELEADIARAKGERDAHAKRAAEMEAQMKQTLESLTTVEEKATKRELELTGRVSELTERVNRAEDFRTTMNRQLSRLEDENADLNHKILRHKAEVANRDLAIMEKEARITELERNLAQTDNALATNDESMRRQRENDTKLRAELRKLREDLEAMQRANEEEGTLAQLNEANKEILRLRAALSQTQKSLDESDNNALTMRQKLSEAEITAHRAQEEARHAKEDAAAQIERLENNIQVLCQNIENSNQMLSMRNRSNDTSAPAPKTNEDFVPATKQQRKASQIRDEMEQWQEQHEEMKQIRAIADAEARVQEEKDLKVAIKAQRKARIDAKRASSRPNNKPHTRHEAGAPYRAMPQPLRR
eukprot:g3647.t1